MRFHVNCQSVEESNIFLRKLWSMLDQITPMGMIFYGTKDDEENIIDIGITNIGEIKYTYHQKGCIDDIIIESSRIEDDILKLACEQALTLHAKKYIVKALLEYYTGASSIQRSQRLLFHTSSEKVEVFNDKGNSYIKFIFEAYSEWDLKEQLNRLFPMICSIFYEYSLSVFNIKKVQYYKLENEHYSFDIQNALKYKLNWIDEEDIPRKGNEILLPDDCISLLSSAISERKSEKIQKLISSAQILYATQKINRSMYKPNDSGEPGVIDIINNMQVTSIEPLADIIHTDSSRCSQCNAEIYGVVKKIRFLISSYMSEDFATHFIKKYYTERSKFFHVGSLKTTSNLHGRIIPRINETGNPEKPAALYDGNLKEYISFIFRNLAHDVLNESVPVFDEMLTNKD